MSTPNSFTRGWSFPPVFKKNGKALEMVSDDTDVKQALDVLFTTAIDERLFHPEYGCDFGRFLFEEMDQSLIMEVKELVLDAVYYFESRIEVSQLDVRQSSTVDGVLEIKLEYLIKETNSSGIFEHNLSTMP